jgi:hypothetical protein
LLFILKTEVYHQPSTILVNAWNQIKEYLLISDDAILPKLTQNNIQIFGLDTTLFANSLPDLIGEEDIIHNV